MFLCGLTRKRIGGFVKSVSVVTAHPLPFQVVAGGNGVKSLPKLDVLEWAGFSLGLLWTAPATFFQL
jgi:hypothetical protein